MPHTSSLTLVYELVIVYDFVILSEAKDLCTRLRGLRPGHFNSAHPRTSPRSPHTPRQNLPPDAASQSTPSPLPNSIPSTPAAPAPSSARDARPPRSAQTTSPRRSPERAAQTRLRARIPRAPSAQNRRPPDSSRL